MSIIPNYKFIVGSYYEITFIPNSFTGKRSILFGKYIESYRDYSHTFLEYFKKEKIGEIIRLGEFGEIPEIIHFIRDNEIDCIKQLELKEFIGEELYNEILIEKIL